MLRLTGAVRVRYPGGEFEAHFDNRSQDADFEVDIESRVPMLTASTEDVESINKDTPLDVETKPGSNVFKPYRFEKHEQDGLGESRVILSL